MQLSSDNADSRQLLRDSMNELRQTLNNSGIATGSLDVGTGDSTNQQYQSGNANQGANGSTGDEMDDAEFFARLATVTSQTASDGSLDVRV